MTLCLIILLVAEIAKRLFELGNNFDGAEYCDYVIIAALACAFILSVL